MFAKRKTRVSNPPTKVSSYVRDLVCLPREFCAVRDEKICIPRGERRSKLARAGLVGKLQFNSGMTPKEVCDEICAVFFKAMGLPEAEKSFEFEYLQRTGAGSRTLCVPAVSESFEWTGRHVASLAKAGCCIYIMANRELSGQALVIAYGYKCLHKYV